jgi:hypothetical protein
MNSPAVDGYQARTNGEPEGYQSTIGRIERFLPPAVVRSRVELALTPGHLGRVVPVSSSKFVMFSTSVVVCDRKAFISIRQAALPGFLRLRSGQALRLRAL